MIPLMVFVAVPPTIERTRCKFQNHFIANGTYMLLCATWCTPCRSEQATRMLLVFKFAAHNELWKAERRMKGANKKMKRGQDEDS